jgi:hypothetical protein
VDRFSFIASDFHRLLLAGLPAHFESDHPSHAVWSLPRISGRVNKIFAFFDQTPLGSASIGQVHVARLFDGRDVVVKVRKPRTNSFKSISRFWHATRSEWPGTVSADGDGRDRVDRSLRPFCTSR